MILLCEGRKIDQVGADQSERSEDQRFETNMSAFEVVKIVVWGLSVVDQTVSWVDTSNQIRSTNWSPWLHLIRSAEP